MSSRSIRCAGCEDGSLHVWDTRSGERLMQLPRAHGTRIRGLVIVPEASSDSHASQNGAAEGPDETLRVATAASDGVLRLWDVWACRAAVDRCALERFVCCSCRGVILACAFSPHHPGADHD